MITKKYIALLVGGTCSVLPLCLIGLVKISYIVGSWSSCFSLGHIFVPLSGAFGGIIGAVGLSSVRLLTRLIVNQTFSIAMLAHGVPGFGASLVWATSGHWAIQLMVPLLCMILFIMHPVGMYAWPYTLYWFIPMSLYLLRRSDCFSTALASTFVAHAIGSVLWLYGGALTSATQWNALIPVVAVERLLFATVMAVSYVFIRQTVALCSAYLPTRLARLCSLYRQ